MTLEELIRAYCQTSIPHEEGSIRHTGFTMDDLYAFQSHVPTECVEMEVWRNHQYRAVWVNATHRIVIIYCEGDIIISQFPDPGTYYKYLTKCHTFYQDH